MLHITNGDSVLNSFEAGGIPGDYLSWDDVLHDGPVPLTPSIEDLSEIRAHALTGFSGAPYKQIRKAFGERDRMLRQFKGQDEVVLWFEHDLFDQLQLLQLLDFFAHETLAKVTLIQIDRHPEVVPFHGLGQLSGEQLRALLKTRQPVTADQFTAGREAWRAFRAADPAALVELTQRDSPGLPFLRAALLRFIEEYPSTRDGLSRHQRQILQAVDEGHARKREIYKASQQKEACPWPDNSVFLRLDSLAKAEKPALAVSPSGEYLLNAFGRDLLSGTADWIRTQGRVDEWLGGVHLTGAESQWRWNPDRQTIEPRP